MLDISIIILTFNEERNLPDCLLSLQGLEVPIYVVDSGSTDRTVDIARSYGCHIFSHPFENYASQRNWALLHLPLATEWVLHMDADHRMTPELKSELQMIFDHTIPQDLSGFLVSRRTVFLGKWIRRGGHYPTYHAILFRKEKGHCEPKSYDQHFVVQGNTKILKGDMIDIITDSLSTFTARHNHWSTLEAVEILSRSKPPADELIQADWQGNPIQQRRYLKSSYYKFPLFLRVFVYFFIRYIVRGGFLDGREGLVFHFLQGFWFRFLVDCKIYEGLSKKDIIK